MAPTAPSSNSVTTSKVTKTQDRNRNRIFGLNSKDEKKAAKINRGQGQGEGIRPGHKQRIRPSHEHHIRQWQGAREAV
ncbi:hypothetical protein J4E80_010093 [Alternaria sp. BMP 0032]|nr:hypothetical protein J4E80_010093 [Alternaria sp. BMP 0032]